MTELSFLIKLFLIPDIPMQVRDLLVDRINEVEQNLTSVILPQMNHRVVSNQPGNIVEYTGPRQAPSTLAAMARHGEIPAQPIPQKEIIEPVAVIAQTQAAAAAMQARSDSIGMALSGKVDKVSGKPRKW